MTSPPPPPPKKDDQPSQPPAPPATMRAWIVTRNGTPSEALTLRADQPTPPAPTSGADLLVRVTLATLNPADVHFIAHIPTWLPFRRSATPGLDFAGVVVVAGPSAPAELSRPGTEVCGALGVPQVARGRGSLAEYLVVPSHLVVPRPKSLSGGEAAHPDAGGPAAGLAGTAGQTAALVINSLAAELAHPGNRVLLNGASGGVGSLLLQVLRHHGAVVTAVCSAANADRVRRLGAADVVDYTALGASPSLYAHLTDKFGSGSPASSSSLSSQQLDIVIDCVGDETLFEKSPGYLKPAGRFVSIVGGNSQGVIPFIKFKLVPTLLGGIPRRYDILGLFPAGSLAREATGWAEAGIITEVPIDSEWAFEDVVKAYEKQMSKRAKGKIVIRVS